MTEEIQLIEQGNSPEVWDELIDSTQPIAKVYGCDEWQAGSIKVHRLMQKLPELHNMKIPNWRLLPISGKSSEYDFFKRLSMGIFNINSRLRPMARMNLQIEPDLWHDLWSHAPILINNEISDIIRCMANAAIMSRDEVFIKQVGNLWWATFEFGGITKDGITRPYGAGILSSRAETLHFIQEGRCDYKPFDLAEILETSDYVTDGYQSTYWIIESFEQLRTEVLKLWDYIK